MVQLSDFLDACGIGQHADQFASVLGVTEMEDLSFVEEPDLQEIGMDRAEIEAFSCGLKEYTATGQLPRPTTNNASSGAGTAFTSMFGSQLVTKHGTVATSSVLDGVDAIGVYFSAHWCPPCRGFTPQLAEIYNRMKDSGKRFEVVFVSSDQDQAGFDEYYNEMPWAALPFSDRSKKNELSSYYGVSGIPSLILLDSNSKVITEDGRGTVLNDPSGGWIPSCTQSADHAALEAMLENDVNNVDQHVKGVNMSLSELNDGTEHQSSIPQNQSEVFLIQNPGCVKQVVVNTDWWAKRITAFTVLSKAGETLGSITGIKHDDFTCGKDGKSQCECPDNGTGSDNSRYAVNLSSEYRGSYLTVKIDNFNDREGNEEGDVHGIWLMGN